MPDVNVVTWDIAENKTGKAFGHTAYLCPGEGNIITENVNK